MCSKFLTLVLVICFSGIDAVTYQEAVDVCKKEYNVPSDGKKYCVYSRDKKLINQFFSLLNYLKI